MLVGIAEAGIVWEVGHAVAIVTTGALGWQATVAGLVELALDPGHVRFRRILGIAALALKGGADHAIARSARIRPPSTNISEATSTRAREKPE